MMLGPRRPVRSAGKSSLGTIVVVIAVIAGVLGWALYDSSRPISVRHVPTETITVPPPGSQPITAPPTSPQG